MAAICSVWDNRAADSYNSFSFSTPCGHPERRYLLCPQKWIALLKGFAHLWLFLYPSAEPLIPIVLFLHPTCILFFPGSQSTQWAQRNLSIFPQTVCVLCDRLLFLYFQTTRGYYIVKSSVEFNNIIPKLVKIVSWLGSSENLSLSFFILFLLHSAVSDPRYEFSRKLVFITVPEIRLAVIICQS